MLISGLAPLQLSPPFYEFHIDIKKSSSRSCHCRWQAISVRVRARSDWDQHSNCVCLCVTSPGFCLDSVSDSRLLASVGKKSLKFLVWVKEGGREGGNREETSGLNKFVWYIKSWQSPKWCDFFFFLFFWLTYRQKRELLSFKKR